jgi:quercetin dioxygenase-like cupin family protein
MQIHNRSDYTIAGRELVAEGADLRVQVLTLEAGQCVPWHYHSEISDSFVCLEGPMVVETRAPRHIYRLLPGERCAVPPKTAHYVHGAADGPCKFLIVQGVGVYDFVPVGGSSRPGLTELRANIVALALTPSAGCCPLFL